jgi:hypothetical protein
MPARPASCRGFSFGLAATAGADPEEMDVVVAYLESQPANVRPGDPVEAYLFEIDDIPAVQADQVMMLMGLGFESRRRAGVAYPGNQPHLHEGIQNTVYGGAGDAGESRSDLIVDLIGCRMILMIADGLEHRPALYGDRKPVLAARPLQLVRSVPGGKR